MAALVVLGAAAAAPAQAAIVGTTDANTLSSALGGPGGASLDAPPGEPGGGGEFADGTDNTALSSFPTAGNSFTILTSGDVNLADDPNDSESSGFNWGYQRPGTGDGAHDPSTLSVPISTPGNANCLVFDYKFFSDEFPEFVGTRFNDAFVAQLDQANWMVTDDGAITTQDDFAAHGTQVSVNGIGPNAVSPDNSTGTTYDAASALLTTKAVVAPGSNHVLNLSIFDSGDGIYDSAVFIDNLRFTNEPPTSCHPPDIFGGQVGGDVTTPPVLKVSKAGTVSVIDNCALPSQATANCPFDNSLVSGGSKRASASASSALSNKVHVEVGPGQSAKVTLKLNKKAKKKIKKKGKVKANLILTNTFNGASSSTKVTLKGKKHRRHH